MQLLVLLILSTFVLSILGDPLVECLTTYDNPATHTGGFKLECDLTSDNVNESYAMNSIRLEHYYPLNYNISNTPTTKHETYCSEWRSK